MNSHRNKSGKGKFERRDFRKKPEGRRDPRPPKAPLGPRLKATLWGVHAVREAWLNPQRRITAFHVTEAALQEFQDTLKQARGAGLKRPEPQIVEKAALDRSLRDAVHQGLALDAEPLEEIFVQDFVVRAASSDRAVVVILDQVTDPHNIGAIMRSACAFGATGIVMQTRHAPEINGTMAKAACGAVEHIPIAYETNLSRAMAHLQEEGFQAVGLDERGPVTLAEIAGPGKWVLVLGAEGKGLRQGLRDNCDVVARLPTQGPIQSLNVSNAAAIALYALSA